ncbi:Agamous-like MADS-box protein AGL17 [Hordeum vulgare]|nr:Agamous-like MADS-box protein AGL17 [Hordeum vulgare]
MPRKDRRSVIAYIEDDKERDVTFFKRRIGLFKSVTDLSVVTGARVAVVLETETEKMYSFGTPSSNPITDAFLSEAPLEVPLADEATTTRIAQLQSEVARLDLNCMREYKENQLSIEHMKKVQEEFPGMPANLIFSKEEDLDLEDLENLSNEISRVHENIGHRLPPLRHGHKSMKGGASMIPNMLPSSGVPSDRMKTIPSSMHSMWSHHLPEHQVCLSPLPSSPRHTVAPHFPQVPAMLHSSPSASVPQLNTEIQTTPNQAHELPPPQDITVEDYVSPCNLANPQNNVNPNSTTGYNLEASPLLSYSGGNDFTIDEPFGYESWGHAPPEQPFYNGFVDLGAYLGYNGVDVGQSSMGNDGCLNAPHKSSSS